MLKNYKSYLVVQEYKVHLYKYERHSCGRRKHQQNVMTFCRRFEFEVLTEFQSGINHTAYAKC